MPKLLRRVNLFKCFIFLIAKTSQIYSIRCELVIFSEIPPMPAEFYFAVGFVFPVKPDARSDFPDVRIKTRVAE